MVGQSLKEERERQAISLKDAAERSKIPLRFLSSIEQEDYKALGGLLYFKRYIKDYSLLLGVYSEALMDECVREFEIGALKSERSLRMPLLRSLLPQIHPRHATVISGGVLGFLIFSYLLYQLLFLIQAPDVLILEPHRELTAAPLPVLNVRGKIARDARVLVNRRPVAIADNGSFEERLYLIKGLNRIDIEAVNISGKSVSETRYVMGY